METVKILGFDHTTLCMHGLLSGLAFLDLGIYTTSIYTFKSYALLTDLYKSISLVRFQDVRDLHSLALLANDRQVDNETYASNLLVNGSNIGYVKFDSDMNVTIFNYDTLHESSRDTAGNLSLVRSADTRITTEVSATFRIDSKAKKHTAFYHKHCTYYCGQNGSIGLILPIDEKIYRRLSTLQNFLITQFWQPAGLNPKSFKMANVTEGKFLGGWVGDHFLSQSLYLRKRESQMSPPFSQ